MVDGEQVEGVQPVRQAVFTHFSSHFRAGTTGRPTLEELKFSTLSLAQGGSLVKPFSIEEVKATIWDCDSYKSPGPDDISFSFLKELWSELQVDIMRFIMEFHRNGKLSKGINSTFITLIPKSVCTATTSVLVNGSPTIEFLLERGLRQGDHLSPFLFLLAAEGLNVMMQAMVQSNLFTGYNVGFENPIVVSHLQFADDKLLLGELPHEYASQGECWLTEATSVLGCKVGKVPFMYLGLPVGGDPCRLSFCDPVVSSIHTRLSWWKNRLLSFGGRLILLKSVLTSLPVYTLAFFKAPLPIKHNLVERNIIPLDTRFFVNGCGQPETANHLFLFCPVFAPLWTMVLSWLGIAPADTELLHDHFAQFVASLGASRTRRSFLQLVWLCCTSVLWQERNNRVFKVAGATIQQMLDTVKLCTYWWLKVYNVYICINTHRWWSSLLVCLGID
ncbi:hypothetical protein TSUD_26750 [Trifolium subterraneum]|uniref:Reverse transcriptase domain-containing protein n=1 Tax=Trifolium subterraneum TaxID=3900 RepID=A0A2Z6LPC6_TRISU|nr:hypothetical protein TSUD_26750 [Trifolium subterraneum]